MKKITLLLLLSLSILGAKAQTYQLNYGPIRYGFLNGSTIHTFYGKTRIGMTSSDTTKLAVFGNAEFKNINSSFASFWRTNQTGTNGLIKSRVGQIGNAGEFSTTYNQDYRNGEHHFDDSTKYAVWTGMSEAGLAIQVAAPGSNTGDIWTNSGSKYSFNNDPSGKTSLNSSLAVPLGDGLLWLNRYLNMPSISGGGVANGLSADSLQLDGGRTRSVIAPIVLNKSNTGNVLIPNSSVGIGTMTPYASTGYNALTINGTSGGLLTTQVNGTNALRIGSDITGTGIIEARNLPINILNNGGLTATFNADHTTTFSGNALVPDDAYDSSWNADLSVPTKNAIWDSLLPITGGTPSFAGTIASTKTTSPIFTNTAASTGSKYWEQTNTGAQLYWGNESSAGGSVVTSAPAYSSFISTGNATDLVLGTNLVKRATVTSSGLDVVGNITAANLSSGTYTPTLTNVTNVSTSSVGSDSQYIRVGNTVFVYGYVLFTQTSTGDTFIGISLPIASNFGSVTQAIGTGSLGVNSSGQSVSVLADTTNDRVQLGFTALTSGTSNAIIYSFSYQIL